MYKLSIDLGVHIKQGKIALQNHVVKKILEFPEKITSRKQLQSNLASSILNCANDFIKDLAKYRSSLSAKLKKTEQTDLSLGPKEIET